MEKPNHKAMQGFIEKYDEATDGNKVLCLVSDRKMVICKR